MATALDIITRAMKKAGILTKSEVPDSDEASDALVSLNNLLSSWSNESVSVYARTTESFTLSTNTASYSIGTGQAFDSSRPIHIETAYIRFNNIDYPIDIFNDDNFNAIPDKGTQTRPVVLNYVAGSPYGTIRLWPTPDQAYTIYIVSEKELGQLTLSSTVELPPGWERALIYNLAVELCPEYGQPTDQTTYGIATEAKRMISASVMRNRSIDVPINIRTRESVLSGHRW